MRTVFSVVSFDIDEALSIKAAPNIFVLEDFNVHHKDWLTYCGRTYRPGELCYNWWSFSNWLNLCLKWSSDRLVIVTKWFLKLLNLLMQINQSSISPPRNLVLETIGNLLTVLSTMVDLLLLLYLMVLWCCLLHRIGQNCLLKSFLRTLILMTQHYLFTWLPF